VLRAKLGCGRRLSDGVVLVLAGTLNCLEVTAAQHGKRGRLGVPNSHVAWVSACGQ
jgi:hypothetical protein